MAGTDLEALKTAAKTAWLYALPLVEIATTRQRGLLVGSRMNTFGYMRNLADHRSRGVTTPNNDTFYATAQIDLSAGPVTINLPAAGERYLSLALMDAYTNNFAILGTRTTGGDGGTFTLVGPTDAAEGPNVVRSPTRHVWALARILVEGPHDLEASRAVQRGVSMQGPAVEPGEPYAPRSASWAEYFASAARLMAENPPPVTDRKVLAQMAPLGLDRFDPSRFGADEIAAIEAGVAEGRLAARKGGLGGSAFDGGWSYPNARLGDFGQDYEQRASVALSGLAALPPVEAMYMRAEAPDGRDLFDGTQAWRLSFPAGALPPVHSFWSLSLYEPTDDGQFFFADNPLNRYAIGDRTPGLKTNADGSLDLWIGHEHPGAEREGNWLPAPAGPFALFMRCYLPKGELLDGGYRLPRVEPA
ncbi:MAG TPA: DUF1254 domain-containing protein [Caulobacteraceae bacterium]|nr:DUF1254 domain-containing protein [Caulobacteraceae bacterium]